MAELSISEQMLYSTIKLTSKARDGSESYGTGFFVSFAANGDNHVPAIVTNKHVVQDFDYVTAILHVSESGNPTGKFIQVLINIGGNGVVYHPNPNVDLCAIMISDILRQTRADNIEIFFCHLQIKLTPEDDDWRYFDAIEDVTMVGCPNGISDEVNNIPIIRRGITATPLSKKYNGRSEFMVDMACFPGSSGSPIFIYNRNGYFDRKTNTNYIGASRVILVGVLYAGPLISNTGDIILSTNPRVSINTMMHLGCAIRSSELRVLDSTIRDIISNSI